MAATIPPAYAPDAIVRGLIPTNWREDIGVSATGETDDGRLWVEISASSPVARHQAEISIGPFVDNPLSDWRAGWRAHGSMWLLRVFNPSTRIKPHQALELNDWS
jgi:hypothetical protein